jgi:hypothetical protein
MFGGRHPFGHDLFRILVAQFVQRETAALGNGEGLFEQRAGIKPGKPRAGSQTAFGVGKQVEAGFRQRASEADRRQRVLKRLPRTGVHVHVAASHQRQTALLAEPGERTQVRRIIGAEVALECDPRASGKTLFQPTGEKGVSALFEKGVSALFRFSLLQILKRGIRKRALTPFSSHLRGQQRQAAFETVFQIP